MKNRPRKSSHSGKVRLVRVVGVVGTVLSIELSTGAVIQRDFGRIVNAAKNFLLPLKRSTFFKKARICEGAVTWPGERDFCPDVTLYGKENASNRARVIVPFLEV